jgi:cation diffusion facilitator CzcD-associated flavoprotein CzcO
MLQRSPTYILSMPQEDPLAEWLRGRVSPESAYTITRWKNVAFGLGFYAFCRRFPERAKKMLVGRVDQMLRGSSDAAAHFTPRYQPWDQRMCLVPDGDLFAALREGRASVVTDHIDRFTESGLRLRSGAELPADIVVTATGLKLKLLGGAEVAIDGKRAELPAALVYKGMMFSDVPNLAIAIGYTNASWTLKCDLTHQYVCRILNHMDRHGFKTVCPRRRDEPIEEIPLIGFSSGYVQRAKDILPRQGAVRPWRLHQNYLLDLATLRRASVEDDVIEFS